MSSSSVLATSLKARATTASSSSTAAASTSSASAPTAGASNAQQPTVASASNNSGPVEASSIDVGVLPLLHDIIRLVEKDNSADPTQRNRDSAEAAARVNELNRTFEHLRGQVHRLPGVDRGPRQQLDRLRVLREQLALKKRLIHKYKALNLKVSGLTAPQH